MNILFTILFYVVMFVIILALYAACRLYVFSKIRINKWIPLAIAIVLFIIQLTLGNTNKILNIGLSILTVLFLLWFMEILQTGGPKKKEKPIVVKNSVTCKPKTVVKVKGRKHSLIFDLIMLCLTGGLWLIWMIIRSIFGY